ncbi:MULTISPECIES: sucrase ferredoxin [Chroococcidiopsis]|jgi:hypothetical protein|uniref:Sucraseferredoxin family protein n=1 Tax=Chroococcidiopsis thermalis (strain PCC 7203) TaxID=251229 RepID=K9TZM3_CHRTP|nr:MULTISPECIES: sucrase ferredoxin [Chroococcidiopsis]AFY88040.1 Sucraseferredoxin family protein [Chroococcidiopsis thermalis PCC 7203]PSB45090.1 sucrase ferredoxin [Cyanosarcina cf. burmensis CCALA 770]URD52965.1 sucrase ferredoxin [Chroococcidiopsis sp. CCNUC1]
MDKFFCAEASRQAEENPIGWAAPCQLYILIECPPPWTGDEFASQSIPANLKVLVEEIYRAEPAAMVLLIYSHILTRKDPTKLLIFRQKSGLCDGYSKQETEVNCINDIALVLQDYLANPIQTEDPPPLTRDILICTHGSHDKCCAKYGIPFYRQAIATVTSLGLENVRIWQSSHFGGHRFAPTALDFPSGRCYGRLDAKSFTSILTYNGDIQDLKSVYRGWGILSGSDYPIPAQLVEQELMLRYSWDWFKYKVASRIVEQNEDASFNCVELTFATPDGAIARYRADVVEDRSKALYLIGDCNGTEVEKLPKFYVKNLTQLECDRD